MVAKYYGDKRLRVEEAVVTVAVGTYNYRKNGNVLVVNIGNVLFSHRHSVPHLLGHE